MVLITDGVWMSVERYCCLGLEARWISRYVLKDSVDVRLLVYLRCILLLLCSFLSLVDKVIFKVRLSR